VAFLAQAGAVVVPIPACLHGRPFTRADAVAAGLPAYVLRGSRFRRLFRGVYVCAGVPSSPELDYDAARLLLPVDAAASHHLAALLRRLPVPAASCTHMCVPRPDREFEIEGLRVHRVSGDTPVVDVAGRRVTSAHVTFLALAEVLALIDLVVLGDAMVRTGMITHEQLVQAAAAGGGRGVRQARRAAALVRPRVDSPMETRLRLLLVLAGLPEPDTNQPATGRQGQWLATPDLRFEAERVVVEYDGRQQRDRAEQYERDLPRRELMDREGWQVIVACRASATYPLRRKRGTLSGCPCC